MSDNHREPNEGGFHLNTDGLNCLPCKCRRKTFHKETKINNEGKTIIEDRSSWKMGRGITPDENDIFKTSSQDNEGVDTATTGWGSRKPTPEERLEKVEEDVERIDKDVNILKNNLNIMDENLVYHLGIKKSPQSKQKKEVSQCPREPSRFYRFIGKP